jgi:putative transposase
MAVGRPMPPLVLTEDDVQQLHSIANSRSLPHSIVQRAQIVLACGAGETNTSIAKRMGLTGMTVGKWRKRYRDQGLLEVIQKGSAGARHPSSISSRLMS